ncbi:MAG TPA: acetyl-CoA carboxylase biotin carboxylase subunit [Vicinamibacterales bacterium]|nr:acetyl-CoA carboxylase biotin carboxylase subunit [Vicinamibacterales bacterium]
MQKILIANRGEIAVRIIRACRDLGLASVAVFSESDRGARHVRMADEAVAIGPSPPRDSYLRIDTLLEAARATGADAVHPGYGFLAENAEFAAACIRAGLTFVGPTPKAIELMGSKTAAREAARAAGVPIVPGTTTPLGQDASDAELAAAARRVGYPIMVKAVAGGGGKGMRVVARPDDLASAVRAARSEAGSSFGDSAIYFERQLIRPRHIEVQILADQHGTVLPFVERECSIQRRHQKVIEETPSIAVSPRLRRRLTRAAAAVASSVGYTNAGTIEFLVDQQGRFYFLEMNTRLQVEHPITELVTGIDLVTWQLRIAQGERLDVTPRDAVTPRGHAIECRIYAEDPDAGFLPSPGQVLGLRAPDGPGVRDDSGVEAGSEISIYYDPLVSKLVVWGASRDEAIGRMTRALREYEVSGVRTSLPFFRWMLREPAFARGDFHTGLLDELLQSRRGDPFETPELSDVEVAAMAVALRAALNEGTQVVSAPAASVRRVDARTVPRGAGWKTTARREGLRG